MSKLVFDHYPLDVNSLPSTWSYCALGDLLQSAQSGYAAGKHSQSNIGHAHLRPMNIDQWGELDLTETRYVAGTPRHEVVTGDILFNNTNSPAWVGKTALVSVDSEAGFSNHMTRLRAWPEIDAGFLAKQLHLLCITGYFQSNARNHINQSSISRDFLCSRVPVLVAPSSDQVRVNALLDVAHLHRRRLWKCVVLASTHADRLLGAVYGMAFKGELTDSQARKNTDDYLERPVDGRKGGGESKALASAELIDDAEVPLSIPSEWNWKRASDVVAPTADIVYGILQPGPNVADGVPYVRGLDIVEDEIVVSQLLRTSPETAERYARSALKPGDVLLGIIRATKVAVVPAELSGGNITQGTARFRPSHSVRSGYLAAWLRSPFAQAWLHARYRGIDMPGLNLSDVRRLPVPVPPMDVQTAIEAVIDDARRRIGTVNRQLQAVKDGGSRLFRRIMLDAFGGGLLPNPSTGDSVHPLIKELADRDRATAETRGMHAKKANVGRITETGLRDWIASRNGADFTFADIRSDLGTEYEELKTLVFGLLDSPDSGLVQFFDESTKTMRLRGPKQ